MLAYALLFILVVTVVLPAVLVKACRGRPPTPRQRGPDALLVNLYVTAEAKLRSLGLDEYVEGVVAAEMPASFEMEALKAQAVVARTLAIRKMRSLGGGGCENWPGADVCSDPTHDQGWISDAEMRQKWGFISYYRYRSRITAAVAQTRGLIILYEGEPIYAVYHSTCGENTENSEDVWAYRLSYLRSVPCKFDTHSPQYRATVEFSLAELGSRVGEEVGALEVMARGKSPRLIEVLDSSRTGRAKTVRVGAKTFKGAELRRLLGLNSTRFSWEITGDRVVFRTRGYGHGVGMCQYGADGLARMGKSFAEIIGYYYTGVEMGSIFDE